MRDWKSESRPTIGGCLLGLGFILMSRIVVLWQLYFIYGVILGMGTSCFLVPIMSTVQRWFTTKRGMITGLTLSGFGVGAMLGPPAAARIIESYGWRNSYLALGIFALIVVVSAAQLIKREPGQTGTIPNGEKTEDAKTRRLSPGLPYSQVIRTSQFWIMSIMFGCFFFTSSVMMVHIVIHAIDKGMSALAAANIPAIMGAFGVTGRITSGLVSDKVGYKRSLVTGFSLVLISLLLLLVAQESWVFYLFACIYGFGFYGAAILESPLIVRLFGLRSIGIIFGTVEFVAAAFTVSSPVLAGHIFDITGSYQIAFLVCLALMAIGLLLAIMLKPIDNRGWKDEPARSP